ncbi:TrkA family potassium uptake protein, partial [Beijerinckia sp. L45]|uniref:potassium channel family protein n=1 Tax=Beijerinckia sp. L45 TaxID=1641855 RepID=UPI00131C6B1D
MLTFLSSPLRNLLAGMVFMLAVSAAATGAYIHAGWSVGDAIYMVVLTVYTVGYDEVNPINTPELRAITIALVITGCTGMIFLTGTLVQLITASQFQQLFGTRRMQKDIDGLTGHVIICGFGRIGLMLARELRAGQCDFVVLERGESRLAACRDLGYLSLQGDATDEDVLKLAGVSRARALATVLPDDAANVFITLSARGLNRELTIIARGEAPTTEKKLLQAGADRVVLPTRIGA